MNVRRSNGSKRDKLIARVRREETHCWLCGHWIDQTLKTPHPGSPEVHEIIPVSKGGSPYDRANCHLTHRACNRRQSNKLDPIEHRPPLDPERQTRRNWWNT